MSKINQETNCIRTKNLSLMRNGDNRTIKKEKLIHRDTRMFIKQYYRCHLSFIRVIKIG